MSSKAVRKKKVVPNHISESQSAPLSPIDSVPTIVSRSVSPMGGPPTSFFVSIIDGKHKGKTLRFIKRTTQRIAVELDDDDGKIAYLMPHHVDMNGTTTSVSDKAMARATEPDLVDEDDDYATTKEYFSSEDEEEMCLPLSDKKNSSLCYSDPCKDFIVPSIRSAEEQDKEKISPLQTKPNRISFSLPKFTPDEQVLVASGSHAGQTAIFVKYTQQRVAVILESDTKRQIRYLFPNSLQPLKQQLQQKKENNLSPSLSEEYSSWKKNHREQADTLAIANHNDVLMGKSDGGQSSQLSSERYSPLPTFHPGDKIDIVSGAHAGKQASFVKYTEQRVGVTIEGDTDDKIRYLMPHSLKPLTHKHYQQMSKEKNIIGTSPMTYVGIGDGVKEVAPSNNVTIDPVTKAFHNYFQDQSRKQKIKVQNCTNMRIQETLFGAIFQENAVFVEADTDSAGIFPRRLSMRRGTIFLAAVKVHQRENTATCAYLYAQSNEEVHNCILRLGSFNKLVPYSKTAARLELLLSTAAKCNLNERPYHVHILNAQDFCAIEENGNVGCGFIPRNMIERFLGKYAVGQRTFALQVRIQIPSMGTFKGVLMEKPGIDKIELPPSMKKVGASSSLAAREDNSAWLMINKSGIFPYLNRIRQQEDQFYEEMEIPEQARWMLTQKGVSHSYLSEKNRHHSNLIGVADPTNGGLPPGSVFLTGFHHIKSVCGNEVIISRFPMTEASDGVKLPVVREKPISMSEKGWDFLCQKPFGVVIFGNPASGQRALPEHIAQGDLDGDGYFVCWDPIIVKDALIGDRPVFSTKKAPSSRAFASSSSTNWWDETQQYLMDQGGRNQRNQLVGVLCNLWKSRLKTNLQQEALSYGRAYKEAIDVKKHGGKVDLPTELWKDVPSNLHRYLR